MLDIFQDVHFDETIVKEELHSYQPYGSNKFGPSDEIRILIQYQDLITATGESLLCVEGNIQRADDTKIVSFTSNMVAFMFDEIRLEISNQILDSVNMPGITTALKGSASYSEDETTALSASGWSGISNAPQIISTNKKRFYACIPLKMLLGFAEDYRRVIVNMRQELILIRARNDDGCYKCDAEVTFEITKIQWKVPHITVNDSLRLDILDKINRNAPVTIAFRKWDLYKLPAMKKSKQDVWSVKTTTQLEKPRFVIVAFQKTSDPHKAHLSDFSDAKVTNIQLHLNSDTYPYERMNLDVTNGNLAIAYQNYVNFQKSYYGRHPSPLMSYSQFLITPIFIIDCSKQSEAIKTSTVDVKLEFEASQAFNESTVAYCLIIHDTIVQYKPFTGEVKKL